MKMNCLIVAMLLMLGGNVWGQTGTKGDRVVLDGKVEFDRIVHDFGDVMLSDGALSCTFTLKNLTSEPMAIFTVNSSCGCTNVEWTREPIAPGKTGSISATYSNDEGPTIFDKTLTVYLSNIRKPVVLRLRGVSHDKALSLSELFPVHFGNIGLKATEFKAGNMNQGSQRSDAFEIANLGRSPVTLELSDLTAGLTATVSPNPIPASGTAKVKFTVTSDRSRWGKNWYSLTLKAGGKKLGTAEGISQVRIWAFTKEDFSAMTEAGKKSAAQPIFVESTIDYGLVKEGTIIDREFKFTNKGKSDFRVYRAETDKESACVDSISVTAPGKFNSFHVRLDTKGVAHGEDLTTITLVTNSPLRPVINLFLAGVIE